MPFPDEPDRILSHEGESLEAFHVQPGAADIATLSVPPADETEEDDRPSV